MKVFADTSFLCSLYRQQANSTEADFLALTLTMPLTVSELVLLELRQSARLQVFNFKLDRTKGYSGDECQRLQEKLALNIQTGALTVEPVDWPQVHQLAEQLSAQHTVSGGHRTMDLLHVATALHARATHFYTFDANQARLAKRAGLKTNLK